MRAYPPLYDVTTRRSPVSSRSAPRERWTPPALRSPGPGPAPMPATDPRLRPIARADALSDTPVRSRSPAPGRMFPVFLSVFWTMAAAAFVGIMAMVMIPPGALRPEHPAHIAQVQPLPPPLPAQ